MPTNHASRAHSALREIDVDGHSGTTSCILYAVSKQCVMACKNIAVGTPV